MRALLLAIAASAAAPSLARAQVLLHSGTGASAGSGGGSRAVVWSDGAWHAFYGDGTQVLSRSSADGLDFGAPSPASTGVPPANGFAAAAFGRRVGLVWAGPAGAGVQKLYYREATASGAALTWGSAVEVASHTADLGLAPALAFTAAGWPAIASIDKDHNAPRGCGTTSAYRPAMYWFDGALWQYAASCSAFVASLPASSNLAALTAGNLVFGAALNNSSRLSTALVDPTRAGQAAVLAEPGNIASDLSLASAGALATAPSLTAPSQLHHAYARSAGGIGYALQDASNVPAGGTQLTVVSATGASPQLAAPESASGCYTVAWVEGTSVKRRAFSGSVASLGAAGTVFLRSQAPRALSVQASASAQPAAVWQEGSDVYFGVIPSGAAPALSAVPSTALADGVTTVALTTTALLDGCGGPLAAGALVSVAASAGQILEADADAALPGIQLAAAAGGTVRFSVLAPASAAMARITAMPAGGGQAARLDYAFTPVPGAPDRIVLTAAGASSANACSPLSFSAQLVDVDGIFVPEARTVTLCASSAAAQLQSTDLRDQAVAGACVTGALRSDGGAAFTFRDAQAEPVSFFASSFGLPGNSAPLELEWTAGPLDPANSGFELDEGLDPVLTARTGALTARVSPRDACGVAVAAPVAVEADAPLSVGAVAADPARAGTFTARLTLPACPPDSTPLGVRARVGGQQILGPDGQTLVRRVRPTCAGVDPAASTVAVRGDTPEACFTHAQASGEPGAVDRATAHLTVTPFDTDGQPFGPGQTVAVAQDPPRLLATSVVDNGDGTYSVDVGSDRCGARSVRVTVNGVELLSSPSLTFKCPAVAAATLTSDATTVPPDGVTAAHLTAAVRDVCGNPAFERAVVMGTSLGELADVPAQTDAEGRLSAAVTSRRTGEAVVAAAVDGVALTSARVRFERPADTIALGFVLAEATAVEPGAAVALKATVENRSPWAAHDLKLRLTAGAPSGLAIQGASASSGELAAAGELYSLPSLEAGGALEISVRAVLTNQEGGSASAVVEDAEERALSSLEEASVSASPLGIDVGCGCSEAGGLPAAPLAGVLALLGLRGRRPRW